MSYQERIDAAIAAIQEHNKQLEQPKNPDAEPTGFIDSKEFIKNIKVMGATSEERLSSLSHEDISECLEAHNSKIKPKILAKYIASIFRQKETVVDEKRPISNKKVDKMTLRELLENFDPEDYSGSIGKRLEALAKQQSFIVFVDNRTIDIDTTLKLLNEIKQGYEGRSDVDVNGVTKKTYKLGELPENYAEENPLYRGRPLRPDGTCDQTGRSWEGIDQRIRQLVRIAMDTNELVVTHETAHNVLDMVMSPNAKESLCKRYRKAVVKLDELEKLGQLPLLKITLGKPLKKNVLANPKAVVWDQTPPPLPKTGHTWTTKDQSLLGPFYSHNGQYWTDR